VTRGSRKDGNEQADPATANPPGSGSRTLRAGGEFLKALASDLAAVASPLKRLLITMPRRASAPRAWAPSRRSPGATAGRLLWRLGVVLLALGTIGAGAFCAVTLWVIFGIPIEARRGVAETHAVQVEAAKAEPLPPSVPPTPAETSRPDLGRQPVAQLPPAVASGSAAPAPAEQQTLAKGTPIRPGAGADQPQPQPQPMTAKAADRRPAVPASTASAAPMRCNVDSCAARYKSFAAADCTYRPYGGGQRRLCELTTGSIAASSQTASAATGPGSGVTDLRATERAAAVPKPAIPARAGGQCDIDSCAAKYSSFHAADCTYQPYGGGARAVCELSSRSADARPPQPKRATTDASAEATDTQVAQGAEEIRNRATPARAGGQCHIDLCAATYKSFHSADCTYQPEDGGPRRICER
jgi:hypothetical protein